MNFHQFDPTNRGDFDKPTHALLTKLTEEFGTVELRKIEGSAEWCVRIVTVDEEAEDRLPLAALGRTPFTAAERLVRICGLQNKDKE